MAVSREKVVQNAERYVSRGKIDAAIKEYRKLLADNPNDISTLNRVGDLYARINRNNEAIDLFTQIAEQYAGDGFFVKAIAIYKKIIKLDPTLLEVYEKLADLYHRQGMVNEARTQYQVLADYYLKHDRSAAAIAIYRRMAELEPDDPSHHVRLAELYRREERFEEAMGEYRAIAELMLQHRKGAEAARVFERALDIDPEDLGFITDAVLKLKESGHVGPAAHFLAVAVARNPKAERVARIAGLPDRAAEAPEAGAGSEAEAVGIAADRAAEVTEPAADLALPAEEIEDRDRSGAAGVAADSEPGGAPEPTHTGTFEFELDFDADGPELLGAVEEAPTAPAFEAGLDHDLLERTAAEVQPLRVSEPEDLLTEAEVLAKYGIEEKALERLAELLQREPDNLEAFRLVIGIHLDAGRHDRAAAVAVRMSEVAERLVDREIWPEVRDRLGSVGLQPEAVEEEPPATLGPEAVLEAPDEGQGASPEAAFEAPAEGEAAAPEAAAEAPAEGDAAPPAALEGSVEAEVAAPEEALEIELSLDDERFELPEIPWEESPGFELDLDEAGPAEAAPARPPAAVAPEEPAPEAQPEERAAAAEEPEAVAIVGEEVARRAPRKRRRSLADLDAALADLAGQVLGRRRKPAPTVEAADEPAPAPPVEVSEPIAAAPAPSAELVAAAEEPVGPVDPLRALGDSLRAELDQGESRQGRNVPAPPAEPGPSAEQEPARAASPAADPDDSAVSWLDEVSAAGGKLEGLEDEGDFFDLGAELEQELSAEGLGGDELLVGPGEQSLEEIVEGFKRGVAESLSPEDFDTHFNLGIAYREMGLLDEAIGEFQLAAKEPSFLVSCASMLGLCFREKGLPELAVKWYQRGLQAGEISDDDRLGLLYDLGEAQLAAGDRTAAYHAFVDAYGVNTNYRDVVGRLAELEPRLTD
jgi:pilus assembly protein FimV